MPSQPPTNFYFILNVSPQAKSEEIKKAYVRLAQIYHPDKNQGKRLATKKFQKISEAWQTLKDPKKRKLFDEKIEKSKKTKQSKGVLQGLKSYQAIKPDIKPEKPIDLEVSLKITLEELCQQHPKTICYFRPVNGKKIKSFFKVQVPPEARSGSRLRFKGKGGAEGKEEFGDFYIRIQIKAHPLFQLIQDTEDLVLECPISFVLAIQGGDLNIPSPYGMITVKLTPPAQHQQLLKITKYGLPTNLKGDRGDLFVKIFIEYPDKEGQKLQKKLEKMTFKLQKIYVKKIKASSFIYPKILKFQQKIQALKKAFDSNAS